MRAINTNCDTAKICWSIPVFNKPSIGGKYCTIVFILSYREKIIPFYFCMFVWSRYTDTDPTRRERAATAGIEPGTSSPGVARSTD